MAYNKVTIRAQVTFLCLSRCNKKGVIRLVCLLGIARYKDNGPILATMNEELFIYEIYLIVKDFQNSLNFTIMCLL